MKYGEQWHCLNAACQCEIHVTISGGLEGSSPRCACGSIMKKQYGAPTLKREAGAPGQLTEETLALAHTVASRALAHRAFASQAEGKE